MCDTVRVFLQIQSDINSIDVYKDRWQTVRYIRQTRPTRDIWKGEHPMATQVNTDRWHHACHWHMWQTSPSNEQVTNTVTIEVYIDMVHCMWHWQLVSADKQALTVHIWQWQLISADKQAVMVHMWQWQLYFTAKQAVTVHMWHWLVGSANKQAVTVPMWHRQLDSVAKLAVTVCMWHWPLYSTAKEVVIHMEHWHWQLDFTGKQLVTVIIWHWQVVS